MRTTCTGRGNAIELTATFDEAVTVTTETDTQSGETVTVGPRIAITVGSATKHAVYASGSGSTALKFTYTVADEDEDTDGIEVPANALALNGATIADAAGNAAAASGLTHAAVAASASHKVDGVGPSVQSVTVTSSAGTDNVYGTGDAIELTATFDEAVTVTAATKTQSGVEVTVGPRIPITVGTVTKHAVFDRVEGTAENKVVFRYVVASGDRDNDGIEAAANALEFNGATIRDAVGNAAEAADLAHAAVAASASHTVNGAVPGVSSVAFVGTPAAGQNDTYKKGDTVRARVTFTAGGGRRRQSGAEAAARGEHRARHDVRHEQGPDEHDDARLHLDGRQEGRVGGPRVPGEPAEEGDGGDDPGGGGSTTVDATLTHAAVAASTSHKVDGVVPTFSSATVDGVTLEVTFSEAMNASGAVKPASSVFTVTAVNEAYVSRTIAGDVLGGDHRRQGS